MASISRNPCWLQKAHFRFTSGKNKLKLLKARTGSHGFQKRHGGYRKTTSKYFKFWYKYKIQNTLNLAHSDEGKTRWPWHNGCKWRQGYAGTRELLWSCEGGGTSFLVVPWQKNRTPPQKKNSQARIAKNGVCIHNWLTRNCWCRQLYANAFVEW